MTATESTATSLESLLGTVGEAMTGEVVALHADTPVDVALRLNPIIALEQPRQPGMADRDVEVIGIIVGDRLPVERSLTDGHPADHAQVLQPVGRNL